tara:strand:+ start:524 stop:2278 length:1755 start_codon:yes stop_codon:yes gene_type:complete
MTLKKWHWMAGAAALLLIGLGTAAFIKREGIKYHLSAWRAGTLLEDSKEAAAENDWKEAQRLALAAWQLNEGGYETLKQLNEASKQEQSRYLLTTSRLLFEHPESTPEDRISVLGLFLDIGDSTTFKALFSQLSNQEQVTPDAMELGVRFLLARNDTARALTLVNELIQLRGTPKDRLLSAHILSRMGASNPAAGRNAQILIEELFQGDSEIALPAFSLLRKIPQEQWQLERFSNATERLGRIEEDAEVPTQFWLLAFEIEMAAAPEDRAIILDQATADWKDTDPVPFYSWLLSLGEAERVLTTIDKSRATGTEEFFRVLLQANIAMKDWPEVNSLLSKPPSSMPPYLVLGLQAATLSQQNKKAASQTLWSRALSQAELATGQSSLLKLAKLAARAGNENIRNRAVTEALKRPSAVNLPVSEVGFLFSDLASNDAAEDLLAVSRNLLNSDPENPVLINNVAWLEIISGRGHPEITTVMKSMVERFPEMPSLRSTLALSHLTEGNSAEAVKVLGPIISEVNQGIASGSSDQAVVSLALAQDGDTLRAKTLFEGIDWKQMMEIEANYFRKAIASELAPSEDETSRP